MLRERLAVAYTWRMSGSGTVGAACQRMGYSYVGCEIVETYAEAAATRLDQRGLWESAR